MPEPTLDQQFAEQLALWGSLHDEKGGDWSLTSLPGGQPIVKVRRKDGSLYTLEVACIRAPGEGP